jgi:hypothetical protein
MKRPVLLAAAVAAIAAVIARRKQAQSESAQLWQEATSDASR